MLNHVEEKNILVVGDVMLDTYYHGDVKRISPEAPVPVFRKQSERSVLGGAANVAANLVAAEQNVSLLALTGNDSNGKIFFDLLSQQGINTDLIFTDERETTVKTRFLASNNQQVIRLDIEDTDDLSSEKCAKILSVLSRKIREYDLILISDYLKGLLTIEFTQGVLQLAKENEIPVIIDVKDPSFEKYKGAYLIKPNLKELHDLTGMPVSDDVEIIAASETLRKKCECDYILTTCGARGMVLVGEDKPYFIGSVGQEVFDVTGAGDTTIAYLAACMVNGFEMEEAVDIANTAAGIQVSKVGTSSVYWDEIRTFLERKKTDIRNKLLSRKTAERLREKYKDRKIVFTNGCFDILHIGHVRYLQEASKLGDILVVGLNADDSVRRLKGPDRPVNNESDRAELLCALEFVDYVVIFDEDTPYDLINVIQPDILVKGGDYAPDEVVGRDIVEDRGGRLVLIPFVDGKSTSNIINKIRN